MLLGLIAAVVIHLRHPERGSLRLYDPGIALVSALCCSRHDRSHLDDGVAWMLKTGRIMVYIPDRSTKAMSNS